MNLVKTLSVFLLATLSIGFLNSCKNKEPSVIKVFVRSASNELVDGAQVVIIGDQNANPPSIAYVDTLLTNSSGFATFDLKAYYDIIGDKNKVGYFDIVAKTSTKQTTGYIRSRSHTTAVETVFLPN